MEKRTIAFCLTILIACGVKTKKLPVQDIVNNIVLVNGESYDRCKMGELIRFISSCRPKVIGIDFLFTGAMNAKCDSILRSAIIQSKNVVLCEAFEKGMHTESDTLFSNYAMLTGVTGLVQSQKSGFVEWYLRVKDDRGSWVYSFPFHLALQYDTTKASELAQKSPSKFYPIKPTYEPKDFKIMDDPLMISKGCDFYNNKIVIIGDLGPGEEDVFLIKSSENTPTKIYGTLLIANAIVDILRDL